MATDIILDVVRAADPAVAQKAGAMLEAAAAQKAGAVAKTPAFQHQLLASADLSGVSATAPSSKSQAPDPAAESYKRFEAMVLQNFIGAMLPVGNEEMYGKGMAGDVWKGMMAEQLGAVLAKGGGIGIAARMLADRVAPGLAPESANGIGSNVSNRASSLVNEVQMQILADISARDDAAGSSDAAAASARRA